MACLPNSPWLSCASDQYRCVVANAAFGCYKGKRPLRTVLLPIPLASERAGDGGLPRFYSNPGTASDNRDCVLVHDLLESLPESFGSA